MSGRCSPASSAGTGRPWCASGLALRRVAVPARGALLQPLPAPPRAAGPGGGWLQTVIVGQNPAGLHGSVYHLPAVITACAAAAWDQRLFPEQLTALLPAARSFNHQYPESSARPPAWTPVRPPRSTWPATSAATGPSRTRSIMSVTSLTVRITPGSGPVLGRASWPRNLAIGLIRQAGHTKIAATIRKIRPCSWPSAARKTHHDQHKRLCRSPCSLPGLAPAVLRLLYLGLTNLDSSRS